jgi:hypothetical protein
MRELGWNATALPPAYAALATDIDTAATKLEALPDSPSVADIADLIQAVADAYNAIQGITVAPPGVDPGPFLAEIGERLFELSLTRYIAAALPTAYSALQALHVIQVEQVNANAGRPGFVRIRFDWSAIPQIVSEPAKLPERVYGWGTNALDVNAIVDHVAGVFVGLRFPVRLAPPSDELVGGFLDATGPPPPVETPSLVVPFFYLDVAGRSLEAAFALHALPAEDGKLPGIAIEPRLPSEFPLTLRLADTMQLRIVAGTNIATTLGVLIRPGGISVKYPFQPGTTPPSAGVGVGFDFDPTTPKLLLGSPAATRLEFGGASVDVGAQSVDGDFDFMFAARLKGLALVLASGEGDSFLRYILGSGESRVELPLGFEASKRHGVRFTGSGAFEVAVHPHLHLGPIAIDDVTVGLAVPTAHPPDVQLELGAGVSGQLGPLGFVVEGVGLRVAATFSPGNVGPFDLKLGFKPPSGAGLSIAGGGFSGGGFLNFDEAKGEYSGGLELEFEGTISLKAIGILNTKLPDGRSGFSLLIIITADFPPIQLGFGFTLLGVGGLLGLNRTAIYDALGAGVRDGSLESVLFPRDIVANAPRIISDLGRIFPPLPDRFLIGPMAKLGWGTPKLVSLELGLILEIPRPAFAILGVLRVELPAENAPLLRLQVNFLGVVDFEKRQISFDASLFDSHLLTFTLTGDMAVRIAWGDDTNFLLTVGGFHPAYTPPPLGLPDLRRLGIVIFQGNPNLRAEAYFAVTSNTVQFGAKVELYAGASVFNVYGFLALDVLIQLNPFKFIAQVNAMLAVRCGSSTLFSVSLELTLEGPTPWHAVGKASFEIGFIITITISVHFEVTFGDRNENVLPPVEVMPKLTEALTQPGNWRARLPDATGQNVSLRAQPPESTALVLHPFGTLEVTQKVVPLNLTIARFGSQKVQNGSTFRVASVHLGTAAAATDSTREQFAAAQFLDMTDAQKLARKSFEDYDAGVRVGGAAGAVADYVVEKDVAYEVIYLPERHEPKLFLLGAGLFDVLVRASAVARSPLSPNRSAPSALATPKVDVKKERFVVASTRDLSPHTENLVFESEGEAYDSLAKLTADDASLASQLQVVPLYELAAR